jgi:hypothetical protein
MGRLRPEQTAAPNAALAPMPAAPNDADFAADPPDQTCLTTLIQDKAAHFDTLPASSWQVNGRTGDAAIGDVRREISTEVQEWQWFAVFNDPLTQPK